MDWRVRNISKEAVERIKEEARSRGMCIGEYLDFVFASREPVIKNGGRGRFSIRSVKRIVQDNFKAQARDLDMSLDEYLEKLVLENCVQDSEIVKEILEVFERKRRV